MNSSTLLKWLHPLLIGAFALITSDVTAQYYPWQVSVQLGGLNPRSDFSINPVIEHSSFQVRTTAGHWWQLGIERKITPVLGVRAGVGRMRIPYMMSTYQELIDGNGRVRLTSSGAGDGGDMLTFVSSGLTLKIPVWGPFFLTSGIDVHIRYNDRAKSTFVFGSSGRTTLVEGRDTLRLSHSFRFTPEATPSFTLSLAPHLGINWQFWERTTVFVSGTYNLGLGYVRQASSIVEANNQQAIASFAHRGSFVSYQLGLTYAFKTVRLRL